MKATLHLHLFNQLIKKCRALVLNLLMHIKKLAQERHLLFSVTSSLLLCTKQVTYQDKLVTLLTKYCPRNYSYDHKVPVKEKRQKKPPEDVNGTWSHKIQNK